MRSLHLLFVGLWLCGLVDQVARAETYQLGEGKAVTGEIVSFNESGLILRQPDDSYSDRIPWSSFSQSDLKRLAENPKIAVIVAPFIEVSEEERMKKTEVELKPVPRLERPAKQSFLGAMASSSVGIFILILLYAGNIYAAHEIAIFRAQPSALVCGVSAVLPVIGPVIFLSLPTRMQPGGAGPAFEPPASISSFVVPNSPAEEPAGGGLHLAQPSASPAAAGATQTQIFQRGAFTFNRRFFETKFPGFFGVVRRDAEKNLVMTIRSARGNFIGLRISRIAANDMHVQVQKGASSEEVMIPFSEIQEIQLKHKDA